MNNPPHGPSTFDRERELEEQHRRALQQEDLAQREREHNERERQERERQHREQYSAPHQNHTSIPLHQPVASRVPGAIHSPGGLLANHGGPPPPPPPSGPLGAPSGPVNAFGGPLHGDSNRSLPHNMQNDGAQQPQHQMFGPNIINHQPPSNMPISGPPGPGVPGFGGPLQQDPARMQQIPFGGQMTPGHQMPAGAPALGQGGQQPILNVSRNLLIWP